MKFITVFKKDSPGKVIQTLNGPIIYYDFLCNEKIRLEKSGRVVKLIGNSKCSFCCLKANNIF